MANTSVSSGITGTKPITFENELVIIEDVRSRAYALYESRGREDGHDLDDWLLAEQQVTDSASGRKRPSPAERE